MVPLPRDEYIGQVDYWQSFVILSYEPAQAFSPGSCFKPAAVPYSFSFYPSHYVNHSCLVNFGYLNLFPKYATICPVVRACADLPGLP
jgi:hypothetical protein